MVNSGYYQVTSFFHQGQTGGPGCARGRPHHREHWTESLRVARRRSHDPVT
jgi:hypothetical protein